MKIIDLKRGKIVGVSIIDLIVIIVVAIILWHFFYNQRVTSSQKFSGYDISKACYKYTWLSNAGFIVKAKVEGKYTLNGSKCIIEGLIYKAGQDRLYLMLYNGQKVTIGGSNAYIEDIAADKIEYIPLSKSTIKLIVNPQKYNDLSEFLSSIQEIANIAAGGYGVSTLKFTGMFVVSCPGLEPTAKNSLDLWVDVDLNIVFGETRLSLGEDYVAVSVTAGGWRIEDLTEFKKILGKLGFNPRNVTTGELVLYIGTQQSLAAPGADRNIHDNLQQLSGMVDKEHITITPSP